LSKIKSLTFYDKKKILVTGHTGFKGGWLSTWLKLLGADVVGLSLGPEDFEAGIFQLAGVADGMASVIGDIRDAEIVDRVFDEHQPEVVFHLAAQALVRPSYEDPVLTYATNIMGTVNVLDAVRRSSSVVAVVNVTTDKCYENREWEWGYREVDALGGHDAYSSSKACSEIVTAAYRRSFYEQDERRVAAATARAGNVIGGGDWAKDRLIPDIVRSLQRHEPVVLRNPDSVRPWQHVLEPLSGYLFLGSQLAQESELGLSGISVADAWNFGPNPTGSLTVENITRRMIDLWGEGSVDISACAKGVHEAHQLTLDCAKSRTRLGWCPMLDISKALQLTIDWYRAAHVSPKEIRALTEGQIEQYSSKLSVT